MSVYVSVSVSLLTHATRHSTGNSLPTLDAICLSEYLPISISNSTLYRHDLVPPRYRQWRRRGFIRPIAALPDASN